MHQKSRGYSLALAWTVAAWALSGVAVAQGQGRGAAASPPTAQGAAPIDLTGYWVSVVTEDWRWRMVTPAKGDYASIPITPEAQRVADLWDPAKDEAAREQCRSYGAPASWQGDSVATWEMRRPAAGEKPKYGDLKVVTTHLRPGYLRKNGVPYSANVKLTEYWDLNKETNGEQWIVVTTEVEDPQYLQIPWLTSLHFKKEPDGSKWDPQPCSARW